MLVEPSKSARRLVGRLEAGSDVVGELTRLCELQSVGAAEVRFYGALTRVELLTWVDNKFEAVSIDPSASFAVVQGSGRVAKMGDQVTLALETMLSVAGPAGQQFVFGNLKSAQSLDVEFVIDVFEDIELRRELDAESGKLVIARIHAETSNKPPVRERATPERIAESRLGSDSPTPKTIREKPQPAAAPVKVVEPEAPAPVEEPEEQAALSWEAAAEASDELSKPASERKRRTTKLAPRKPLEDTGEADDDAELMQPGDILDHPKLGRCRVIRVEEEEYAHIRLARGQIRKLSLEVCEINWESEEDGRNIFKIRIRK